MGFFDGLASALIGGIFQRNSEKRAYRHENAQNEKQRKWQLDDRANEREYAEKQRDNTRAYNEKLLAQTQDLSAARKRAEAAGLNFASYIKGGGGSGGISTPFETVAGANGVPTPVLTSSVGRSTYAENAVATFFNQQTSELDEERDRLEVEIMREELAGLRSQHEALKKTNWGYSIPHAVTTSETKGYGASRKGNLGHVASGRDAVSIAGRRVDVDEGWTDTQIMEDRYGDLVSLPYGFGVLAADVYKGVKRVQHGWSMFREAKRDAQRIASDRKNRVPTGKKAKPAKKYGDTRYKRWPDHSRRRSPSMHF